MIIVTISDTIIVMIIMMRMMMILMMTKKNNDDNDDDNNYKTYRTPQAAKHTYTKHCFLSLLFLKKLSLVPQLIQNKLSKQRKWFCFSQICFKQMQHAAFSRDPNN